MPTGPPGNSAGRFGREVENTEDTGRAGRDCADVSVCAGGLAGRVEPGGALGRGGYGDDDAGPSDDESARRPVLLPGARPSAPAVDRRPADARLQAGRRGGRRRLRRAGRRRRDRRLRRGGQPVPPRLHPPRRPGQDAPAVRRQRRPRAEHQPVELLPGRLRGLPRGQPGREHDRRRGPLDERRRHAGRRRRRQEQDPVVEADLGRGGEQGSRPGDGPRQAGAPRDRHGDARRAGRARRPRGGG